MKKLICLTLSAVMIISSLFGLNLTALAADAAVLGKNTVTVVDRYTVTKMTFTPSKTGKYRFYSVFDNDPCITVYEGSDNLEEGDDESGRNFDIVVYLNSGTAYTLVLNSYNTYEITFDMYIEEIEDIKGDISEGQTKTAELSNGQSAIYKFASAYEVTVYSNKACTKKVSTTKVKKTSATFKKLKKGKTYYVRVRPLKKYKKKLILDSGKPKSSRLKNNIYEKSQSRKTLALIRIRFL